MGNCPASYTFALCCNSVYFNYLNNGHPMLNIKTEGKIGYREENGNNFYHPEEMAVDCLSVMNST
jgi:23S rRNA C2498 (ribose-2'-O)-methylase RlmM